MHFFRHTLFFFIILSTEISAQTLSVQDVSVYSGRQVDLVVKLVGGANMTSLQFNLNLPEGLIVDKSKITLCAATDGHTLNVVDLDSGDQLFVLYHLDSKSFKDGELLRIPLIARYNEGAATGKIYTVRTATADAVSHECMNAVFNATIINETEVKTMSYTREYGDENPKFEYTVDGAVLMGSPEISCDATASSPVGEYPIVISKGSVTNYNDTYVNGILTITKAPLTVSVGTYTKKQGEVMPDFAVSYEGFKNDETKEVLTKQAVITCEAAESSAPGEYTITVSGAEAQNYDISYVSGKLIVTDADPVTVNAQSYTREYGDENPTFEYTVEGAVLEGSPEISCEAAASSPVGEYPIVISKGSVTNYNDIYVNGTLSITKAPLTVSVSDYSREQGQDNPEFILNYSGWKNGEDEIVLDSNPTATTIATKDSEPGDYLITVSGGEAKNYFFEYKSGKLTINEPSGMVELVVSELPLVVYTITGIKLNVSSVKALKQGVYIVNGRKVIRN